MTKNDKYLTTSEVARRLRLSAERIRQLARNGELPADLETEAGRLWLSSTIETFEASRRSRTPLNTEPSDGPST